MPTIRENALSFLCRELRAAKIALGHAESKPNVRHEELDNLQNRIDAIDWMIPIVIREDEHDNN